MALAVWRELGVTISREDTAAILEEIADSTDRPADLATMLTRRGLNQENADTLSQLLLVNVLCTFGALRVNRDGTLLLVQPVSSSAADFIRSVAAYLRAGQSVLSDLERDRVDDGPYSGTEVLSGPQLLYLMERQRAAANASASTLRTSHVVQVLIKVRLRLEGGSYYLVQFDPRAGDFQLIGGHIRDSDDGPDEAAKRELREELPNAGWQFSAGDRLIQAGEVDVATVSRTTAVNTRYIMTFYHVTRAQGQVHPGPGDRWVSEKELLAGRTKDGQPINSLGVQRLNERLPGGLASLPPSVRRHQRRGLREAIRAHPWEAASIAIGTLLGVAGIVLTILLSS